MSGPNTDYDPVEVTPLKADQVEAMRDAAPVIEDRLPPEVARCVLQHLPDNQMRAEVLDDPRAWNLGRSRAEPPLTDLGLLPAQDRAAHDALSRECAGVWASFGE